MRTLYLGSDDALALRVARLLHETGVKAGRVEIIEVLHDAECPRVNGGMVCKCRPDFRREGCTT